MNSTINCKKNGQNSRKAQSYFQRQKFITEAAQASGDPSATIQIHKIPVQQFRSFQRQSRAVVPRDVSESKGQPDSHQPLTTISYKDVRLTIDSRAEAECPRAPPNTPPPEPKYFPYKCGDFIYDIPGDDSFARRLFEAEIAQDESNLTQIIDQRVSDHWAEFSARCHGQGATSAHFMPPSCLRDDASEIAAVQPCVTNSGNTEYKDCQRNVLQSSDSAIVVNTNPIHPKVVTKQCRRNAKYRNSTDQNQKLRAKGETLRPVGDTRSHSDLGFVPNPRIAKFLEEIKAAKELKKSKN